MINFGTKKNKNGIEVNSKGEFNVFFDIIIFSKKQVFSEMKEILNKDVNVEDKMDNAVFKYKLICDTQNLLADINDQGIKQNDNIFIPIENVEADLFATYSSKMLNELLKSGFDSNDKNLTDKAMAITYSTTLFQKLSEIAATEKKNRDDLVEYSDDWID